MKTENLKKLKKINWTFKIKKQISLFIYNILWQASSSSFWLHNVKRETRGRQERISGKDVQSASDTCSFWSLYRQFFNKKSRRWSWRRCHEIVITDGLYLRSKNTSSINICEQIGYFTQGQQQRRGIIFYIKNTV